MGEIGEGKTPSLLLVFMTANMDHERALSRLNIITEGKVENIISSEFGSFFGRSFDIINCFRYLLTFRR